MPKTKDHSLPRNTMSQQLQYAVDAMRSTPKFVKMNSLFAGILLLPFTLAVVANLLTEWATHKSLYHSFLWNGYTLRIWILYLPVLSLIVAAGSYLSFLFRRREGALSKRITDVIHSWPLLITGVLAFAILCLLIFHDSGRCWLRNPLTSGNYFKQSWRCSVGDSVHLNMLAKRAF